ncbi:ATP-binding cassette, subfamily G (WHITE), member 2 [Enteropsectra breve]|nr:ATP-binding cassette, subfamily G (WHITE), member 2 [Enteropsectra breve]KAI5151266.1 ATP-binding cassette, subfamily G (WHITE), member 2 [Enteropsectra breve]KAI5151267.1 ATP-binding cassette, subfamily G (WHITE), member 2 [Enteropsectra breve]
MEKSDKKTLTVTNFIYRAKNSAKHKTSEYITLLKNVSCTFTSGNIYAIMGPSGSCKTTFLNSIAGYIPLNDLTSGSITYNGKDRDESWLNEFGLVEQDDPQPKKVTVIDYIRSEYLYRVGGNVSKQAIEANIEEVLKLLEITRIANRDVSVVSGGERKRTMIAVELLSNANVLILDEPTSGLDSNLALKLVTRLKEYAVKQNKIVLLTVHQPGPGLFSTFDNLLFFYKGALLYNGPVSEVEQAFATMGLVNTTSLSISEFLFEVFSETNILKNGEELTKIREDLVKSEEIKNQTVYAAASIKKGGYRLFAGGFSFRGLYLNFKELISNDFKYWPCGMKFVKDLLLLALYFGMMSFYVYSNVKKSCDTEAPESKKDGNTETSVHVKLTPPSFIFMIEMSIWVFWIFASILFSGSFLFHDTDTMKRRMKRKKYSVFTAICSGLLYNGPLFLLGLVLNFSIIKFIFMSYKLDTTIDISNIVFLVIYTLTLPIVQLFFSTLSVNFFIYLIATVTRLYFAAFHLYDHFIRNIFIDRNLYMLIKEPIDEKSPFLSKLAANAYKVVDMGFFSILFPYRHLAITKFTYILEQIKDNKTVTDKVAALLSASENEDVGVNRKYKSIEDKRKDNAIPVLFSIFSNLKCYIFDSFKHCMEEELCQKVSNAKNVDEFFHILRSEGIKKLMFLYLGKYFSMIYMCVTLVLLLGLSALIINRRFAPEVRYKL